MANELKNYVVNIHGRGASYCVLMQNTTLEDCVAACQHSVNCGFEVFIYSIEPSPLGSNSLTPPGGVNLRRHFHLYDAHDEFIDEARSIVNKLSAHSVQASLTYLENILSVLHAEREGLQHERRQYEPEEMSRVQTPQVHEQSGSTTVSEVLAPEPAQGNAEPTNTSQLGSPE